MNEYQLVIDAVAEDEEDFADIVKRIADMIKDGYTSGYPPYWTLIERE